MKKEYGKVLVESICVVDPTVSKHFSLPFLDRPFPRRTIFDALCQGLSDWKTELFYVDRFYEFKKHSLIEDDREDDKKHLPVIKKIADQKKRSCVCLLRTVQKTEFESQLIFGIHVQTIQNKAKIEIVAGHFSAFLFSFVPF